MKGSQTSDVFTFLYILWGFITVVLVVLLSYRATLMKEEHASPVREAEPADTWKERKLIARQSQLNGEIIALSVISAVLLLTGVGFSIYFGTFGNF
jgi:hypothetical protein